MTVLLGALLGCGRVEPPPPSLVLLTLDTTRADRLGAYGYMGAHTPNLDALALEGVRFESAYTVVPLTTPSHASMLTGLYPSRHGIRTNGDATLPEEARTLAEVLSIHGYQTVASVGAFVTTRMWNLDQGFDDYFDAVGQPGQRRWSLERPADEVVDDALGWLRTRQPDRPFFLWAHFYDPHEPYVVPPPWPDGVEGAYDAEIAFMDEQIGRLRAAVQELRLPGGVSWMVVGDHGEALLGEHGEVGHGLLLFEPTVRVPFLMRGPEPVHSPLVEDEAVSVVDVMPTALGILGIEVPEGIDGADLSTALLDELPEREPVVMESLTPQRRFGWHPEIAVVDEGVKLMDTPSPRLFDLVADPGERDNRVDADPQTVARLRAVAQAVQSAAPVGSGDDVDGVAAQLQALGYVVGDATGTDATVDVKDRLSVVADLAKARVRLESDPADGVAAFRAILEVAPGLGEARSGLAHALQAAGKPKEALAVLDEAVEQQPDAMITRLSRGQLLLALGRRDEAEADARHVLEHVPEDQGARQLLIEALTMAHPPVALEQLGTWREQDPDDAFVIGTTGLLLLAMGRDDEAEPLLRKAADADIPPAGVHRAMATVEELAGRSELVAWHLAQEVALYPSDLGALRALADHRMSGSDWSGAALAYEALVTRQPAAVDARRAWAQAVFNEGSWERAAEILAPAISSDDPHVLTLHANLLAKAGEQEQAEAVFARAQRLARKRLEEAQAP
ncbi:MAG: sulfatase-like hydrolase/transferase [Myxococcales bacterium]|nr:sulfatase-like hydrolase/transferase [Myxococcales bacterium]